MEKVILNQNCVLGIEQKKKMYLQKTISTVTLWVWFVYDNWEWLLSYNRYIWQKKINIAKSLLLNQVFDSDIESFMLLIV